MSISGEPGMGKTTLVESVLRELETTAQKSWFVARGRCSERLAGAEAYLPLLEALNSLLEGDGRESVARIVKALAPAWHLQLAVASEATAAELQDMKAGSQERLKRQLMAVFEELSRLRPIIVFIDDLHWADALTVDLLSYLGAHFDRIRLLVVATYRGTELELSANPFRGVSRELQAHNRGARSPWTSSAGTTSASTSRSSFPTIAFRRSCSQSSTRKPKAIRSSWSISSAIFETAA